MISLYYFKKIDKDFFLPISFFFLFQVTLWLAIENDLLAELAMLNSYIHTKQLYCLKMTKGLILLNTHPTCRRGWRRSCRDPWTSAMSSRYSPFHKTLPNSSLRNALDLSKVLWKWRSLKNTGKTVFYFTKKFHLS